MGIYVYESRRHRHGRPSKAHARMADSCIQTLLYGLTDHTQVKLSQSLVCGKMNIKLLVSKSPHSLMLQCEYVQSSNLIRVFNARRLSQPNIDKASSSPSSQPQYPSLPHLLNMSCKSLGNVTLGTITVLSALGAFFGVELRSPFGWY